MMFNSSASIFLEFYGINQRRLIKISEQFLKMIYGGKTDGSYRSK